MDTPYMMIELMERFKALYPLWTKRCVKRKHGKHPAHYIDVIILDYPDILIKPGIPNVKVI